MRLVLRFLLRVYMTFGYKSSAKASIPGSKCKLQPNNERNKQINSDTPNSFPSTLTLKRQLLSILPKSIVSVFVECSRCESS